MFLSNIGHIFYCYHYSLILTTGQCSHGVARPCLMSLTRLGCRTSPPAVYHTTSCTTTPSPSTTSPCLLRWWWRRVSFLPGGWPGHRGQWTQSVLVTVFYKLPYAVVQTPLSLWVKSSWHKSITGRLWQECVWRPQGEAVLLALSVRFDDLVKSC